MAINRVSKPIFVNIFVHCCRLIMNVEHEIELLVTEMKRLGTASRYTILACQLSCIERDCPSYRPVARIDFWEVQDP